jgi:hypothetical protein
MSLLSEGHSGKPVASCCCRLVAIAPGRMAWSHAHNPLVGTDRKDRRTYRRRRRFSVRLARPLSLPTAIIAISIANVAAVATECGRHRRRKERERRKEACDSRTLSAPWRRSHVCERYIFSSSPAHLRAAGRSPFILRFRSGASVLASPLPVPLGVFGTKTAHAQAKERARAGYVSRMVVGSAKRTVGSAELSVPAEWTHKLTQKCSSHRVNGEIPIAA